MQKETSLWYHMICNVVLVVFWGTLLRPTAGDVVFIRRSTIVQNVLWLCASIQEESCVILSWSSTASEHGLVGRRNCPMTEAANSLSAAAARNYR